jgi:prephenate dehydrogenase
METWPLSILGVGLLGGSIGLAAKAKAIPCHITGYGHRQVSLDAALQAGAIDVATTDLAQAVRGARLVILATPIRFFEKMLESLAPLLPPGSVVTDVGSTKRSVVAAAERILPAGVHFVGSHPMAGSEKQGVEWARADLFTGARCLMTPTKHTDPEAFAFVRSFWSSLGMRLTELTAHEHDRRVAEFSHLPHLLAAALVSLQDEAALDLVGNGFLDTTRIAGGDGSLWRDILLDNQDNVQAAVGKLRRQLGHVLRLLKEKKGEELAAWLNRASTRRRDLMARKLRELHAE